jgi:catechol 2,3-dioxygenase
MKGGVVANAGARLMLAPDWKPTTWTEDERRNGQARGLRTIETFDTHGLPAVAGPARGRDGCWPGQSIKKGIAS